MKSKPETKTENGFKETEIGLIPSDWDIKEFKDCVDKESISRDIKIPRGKYNKTGRYPIIDQGAEFIAGYTNDKDKLYSGNLPVIVFGDHTRIFKFVDFPFSVGADGTKLIQPKNFLYPKYFFYYLSSLSIPSKGYNRHYKYLKENFIVFPQQKSEQQKIAFVLSKIQQAIERQDKIIQTTKELKKSLMNKLFTEGLHGEEQKETEIGLIPKSWEVGELKNIVRHKIVDGVHKTPKYVQEGIPFVTAKDIVDNKVSLVNCKYITEVEHLVLTKRVKPEKEDILLTKVGTVGNVALVRDNLDFSIFVQVALIKPDLKIIFPEYLFFCLQSDGSQKEIINNTAQSTMKFIGTQNIGRVKVPLPSIREQQKIANILSNIDKKLAQEELRKQTLQALFKTMLNQLMIGRIRVKDLEVEVQPARETEDWNAG